MFRPVGSQPPSVYWRRRLLLVGGIVLAVVLIALTVKIVAGDGTKAAAGTHPPTGSAQGTPGSPTSHTSSTHSTGGTTTANVSHGNSRSSSVTTQSCDPAHLAVAAVVAKPTYQVGNHPVVELQVTNTGTAPCVQDLADKQIELRVYNGESRVWGSHDCQIEPGTNPRTLAVNRPVRVSVTWSGLTSQPKCAGTRQRVGAGTYTLYALLSGKTGKATQFTIS